MNDPSGESLEMPMELLEDTPFDDYLIPGILLFFGNGVLSLLIAGLTIKKVRCHPLFNCISRYNSIGLVDRGTDHQYRFLFPTDPYYILLGFHLVDHCGSPIA